VRTSRRTVVAVLVTATLVVASQIGLSPAASAGSHSDDHGVTPTKVYTLDPSTHGNPEGVAWDSRTDTFFVGATGDGTIYRGKLTDDTITPFITPAETDGRSAVGMKVFRGKLYVAGGATGLISVYDIKTGSPTATFATGPGGFLNDLVVTGDGDVYVTDSFRPTLWHVTASQVAAGSGVVDPISVSPEIRYTAGDFNLNGIVAFGGGRELVVVSSVTGQLFRITFDSHATNDRRITPVDAPALVGGDGMIMDRGRLVVVTGAPARLNFLALSRGHSKARLVDVRPDSTLRGPSTVARAEDRYLVVNADFGTSTQPFTVSGLARGDGS